MTRTCPFYWLMPLAIFALKCDGFNPAVGPRDYATTTTSSTSRRTPLARRTSIQQTPGLFVKGFGKSPEPDNVARSKKKVPSAASIERQQAVARYDEIAAMGGQEYKIFVRQFGGDDDSWLPCGSIAVPRTAQVANAIKANVDNLKLSIVRSFPKLKGQEEEFEFGYNLKIYPDDPIEVANLRTTRMPTQGFSIGNWISTLLSPVDASGVIPPPSPETTTATRSKNQT